MAGCPNGIKKWTCGPTGLLHDARQMRPITRFSTVQGEVGGGQGQNRTADTGIFSPLLYRLSYLAKSQISEERLENSHCN